MPNPVPETPQQKMDRENLEAAQKKMVDDRLESQQKLNREHLEAPLQKLDTRIENRPDPQENAPGDRPPYPMDLPTHPPKVFGPGPYDGEPEYRAPNQRGYPRKA